MAAEPEPGGGRSFRRSREAFLLELGRELRAEGVPVTPSETLTAARAVALLDPQDPEELQDGLRAAYLSRRSERPAFDRVFRRLWRDGSAKGGKGREPSATAGLADGPAAALPRAGEAAPEAPPKIPPTSAEGRRRAPAATDPAPGRGERPSALRALYSPAEAGVRTPPVPPNPEDVRDLERELERVLRALSRRRGRRREPGRRGLVDLRRSYRDALRHQGELVRLARRRRRPERPRLVLLCDVSGSMERHSRFLLRLLLSARAPEVEAFAFSTRLVHLSPWLADPAAARAWPRDRWAGWSGGTRIGACLETFLREHGRRLLGRRSVVVILSDGLDRGEIPRLERAMRALRRRTRKVIWLNPLAGDPGYRPEARGMKAALPFVDHFGPGRGPEALRELARALAR